MTGELDQANKYIESFASLLFEPERQSLEQVSRPLKLKVGVDLGTCNVCMCVLDENNTPVAGDIFKAAVVQDGLVVNYFGAVEIVRKMKKRLEGRLGVSLATSSAAVPPGTVGRNAMAVVNVIRSADMDVTRVVDEPTAAAAVLNIQDGAVVDVGGGTTGISVLRDGKVEYTNDEPTGGTHMTLVIAGHYRISTDEAEKIKLDAGNQKQIFPIVKPVIEKMASIVNRHIAGRNVKKIYLVGGASAIDGFEEVFQKETGILCLKSAHPLLVTPLGIAISNSV